MRGESRRQARSCNDRSSVPPPPPEKSTCCNYTVSCIVLMPSKRIIRILRVETTRGFCIYGSAKFITLAYLSDLCIQKNFVSFPIALSSDLTELQTYSTQGEEKRCTYGAAE